MENARFTAIFLIALLLIMYYVIFCTSKPVPKNVEDAVMKQGIGFKGTDNTLKVEYMPPLSIPIPNVSANCYAGTTPKF